MEGREKEVQGREDVGMAAKAKVMGEKDEEVAVKMIGKLQTPL